MFTLGSFVRFNLSKINVKDLKQDSVQHKMLNIAMRERLKADKRYAPRIKKDGETNA